MQIQTLLPLKKLMPLLFVLLTGTAPVLAQTNVIMSVDIDGNGTPESVVSDGTNIGAPQFNAWWNVWWPGLATNLVYSGHEDMDGVPGKELIFIQRTVVNGTYKYELTTIRAVYLPNNGGWQYATNYNVINSTPALNIYTIDMNGEYGKEIVFQSLNKTVTYTHTSNKLWTVTNPDNTIFTIYGVTERPSPKGGVFFYIRDRVYNLTSTTCYYILGVQYCDDNTDSYSEQNVHAYYGRAHFLGTTEHYQFSKTGSKISSDVYACARKLKTFNNGIAYVDYSVKTGLGAGSCPHLLRKNYDFEVKAANYWFVYNTPLRMATPAEPAEAEGEEVVPIVHADDNPPNPVLNETEVVKKIIPGNERPLQLAPVPASEELNVRFIAETNGPARITIVDMTGRSLLQKEMTTTAGNNNATLSVRSLADGQYLVRLQTGATIRTQKLVIQR